MCIPSIHAVVSTPAELQSAFVADFPCNAGLPHLSVGSASASIVSGPHRAFTCVTACIFAGSPSDPFHRRLRRIRCLLRRFDCYWASDPSQAGLPPAEIHTHSRRTDKSNYSILIPFFSPQSVSIRPVFLGDGRVKHESGRIRKSVLHASEVPSRRFASECKTSRAGRTMFGPALRSLVTKHTRPWPWRCRRRWRESSAPRRRSGPCRSAGPGTCSG